MNSDNFSIKEFEGINFAKLSGDNNIIHIDKIAGYNSIHGHNIVHGVLVILKFLNKIKLKKKYSYIKVLFAKGFRYNSKIKIRKIKKDKHKILYELIQQNNINANIEIGFSQREHIIQTLKKTTFKKEYPISKKMLSVLRTATQSAEDEEMPRPIGIELLINKFKYTISSCLFSSKNTNKHPFK